MASHPRAARMAKAGKMEKIHARLDQVPAKDGCRIPRKSQTDREKNQTKVAGGFFQWAEARADEAPRPVRGLEAEGPMDTL